MSWVGGNKRRPRASETPELRAFRRRKRRRRMKRAAAWLVLLALVGGAGFGGYSGSRALWSWIRTDTDWTQVRAVNARSTQWIPEWHVVELSGVVPGDDLLSVHPDTIRTRLVRHPRIAGAEVSRRFWDRSVNIKVLERRPLAVILDGGVQEMALGGLTLGRRPDEPWRGDVARGAELPLLSGDPCVQVPPGTRVEHPGVRRALAFLALLEEYEIPGHEWISEIQVSDPEGLVAYLLDGGTPVHLGKGRVSRTS